MTYIPKIDDYVKWRNVEGWVYYVDEEYITIEISVKDKGEESIKDMPLHRKVHCLMVCYRYHWNEIKYIHTRRYKNATNLDDMEVFVREF
jgi:hypothetical protein